MSLRRHLSAVEKHLARVYLGLSDDVLDTIAEAPPFALLVGEAPSPRSHWRLPLFPWPASSTGARMVRLLEMTPQGYLSAFQCAHLCDDGWDRTEAMRKADDLVARHPARTFILLGSLVADVFGVMAMMTPRVRGDVTLLAIPYLSEDPTLREQARDMVRKLVVSRPPKMEEN